eukprot:TRINITY_DN3120_c0_g1_i2.p1 TRINITY_DN3120_c0_g1~~TRINITY_DN3120_c0_g1_i2.p1  ORF type:complete len:539 (-),score=135.07 TRINITY_DN3120_c0_g1_i2:231-1784(-)
MAFLTKSLALGLLATEGVAAAMSLPDRVRLGECEDTSAYASGNKYFPASFQVGVLPSPVVRQAEVEVHAADLIDVAYGNNFKILTDQISKEQYVLTQCGTPEPSESDLDAVVPLEDGYQRKRFTIPLQSATAASTVQLSFLEKLGVEDRVYYVDGFSSGPCWQKAMQCGAILESAWGGNATLRAEQMASVDAVFMDCSGDCADLRAQSNAVHFSATKDNGNLHSAEYIKFMAAFFNLEEVAKDMFDSTVAAYTALATEASNPPVIVWISSSSWSKSFVLSQASYKQQLITAVGGKGINASAVQEVCGPNMTATDSVSGNPTGGKEYSLPWNDMASAETFMTSLEAADIVIDETYAADPSSYTFESFLSTFGLTDSSSLKFIQNKMVMRVDGTLSEALGLDWFESRVAHPEWAVGGLARVVNLNGSQQIRKYFRNIAKGEQPDVLTSNMCTKELAPCSQSATPEALKMLTSMPTTTESSTEPSHESNTKSDGQSSHAWANVPQGAGLLLCIALLFGMA